MIERVTGQAPAGYELPEVPWLVSELHATWQALYVDKPAGWSGAGALLWSELVAWQQAMGVSLSGWELETLKAMDRAAMSAAREDQSLRIDG